MPPKEQSPLRNEENFDTQSKYSKKKNKDSEKYSAVRQFYKGLVGVVFLLVGYAVYYDMQQDAKPNKVPLSLDPNRYEGLQDHSFYGVIRHAEKANLHDKENPRWVVEKDPPLSRRGERQAAFTGKYLKEYFEKLGVTFDKIVIETSPFMRCVQTANEIALALGVKEVEINYLFAEHLAERDYGQYNPLPKLQTWENQKDLNDKGFKEFNLLSDKVRIVDKGFWRDNLMPRYIEKLSVVQERVMLTAEYFVDKFNELRNGGSFNKGQKVCYLVISHGMITMQQGNMLDQLKPANKILAYPNPVNYKTVSESHKKNLVKKLKDWDWEFQRYLEDGKPNPNWIGYTAMNLFAVRHNEGTGEFEDFRVLEKKSNEMFNAFEKVDPPPENYDWEVAQI